MPHWIEGIALGLLFFIGAGVWELVKLQRLNNEMLFDIREHLGAREDVS